MSDVFDFRIRTRADLVCAVERFGFVPFFKNRIQGFSLAEHAAPDIEDNIHLLQEKLEELGYNCQIQVTGEGRKVNFVDDFLKQDVPKGNVSGGEMLRYSFDVRA